MYKSTLLFLASAALFGAVSPSSAQVEIPGNHYLCFPPRSSDQPQRNVEVSGPIGAGHLEVLQITEICGMVKKIYSKKTYSIDDKYPAIVCYAIKPGEFKVRKIAKEDQFGIVETEISQPRELCLPAKLKL